MGLAAAFIASAAIAGEVYETAPNSDAPSTEKARLVAIARAASQRATSNRATRPGAVRRQDMMAYGPSGGVASPRDRFGRLAQAPPRETEEKPPADVFEKAEPPAELPEEPPDEVMPDVEAARPSKETFEAPTEKMPPESPQTLPGEEPAPFAPPRGRAGRARQAPPETLPESRGSQPPEPQPESVPYEGGAFSDESLDMEGFVDECCDLCDQCVEGPGYWDGSCPPLYGLDVPYGTWVNVDYLMWWSRGQSLPPLVTTGSQNGALSDPNVRVLFGDERVDTNIRSGGRINIGTWLNTQQTWGIGASFLQLQNVARNYDVASTGPILARPFFNTATGADDSEIVAQSGIAAGGIRVRTTDAFVAGDAYFRQALAFAPAWRMDLIYGWRYLQMSESLSIDDRTVSTDPFNPQVPLGTTIVGRDEFRAINQFNGGQIGLMTERRNGIWSLSTVGKISFGNMHQTVLINGDNTVTEPGVGQTHSAGSLLAQPSNIGRYDRNVFAVVPEVMLNLGIQISPQWRGTIGYSLIYIDRVAQASNQVDLAVDPNQFGGGTGTAPTFRFQESHFWVQGLNFGLNYRF
jgi:hypothetical protein